MLEIPITALTGTIRERMSFGSYLTTSTANCRFRVTTSSSNSFTEFSFQTKLTINWINNFQSVPTCFQLIQTPLDTNENIIASGHLHKNSLYHDIWSYKKILHCRRLFCIWKFYNIWSNIIITYYTNSIVKNDSF